MNNVTKILAALLTLDPEEFDPPYENSDFVEDENGRYVKREDGPSHNGLWFYAPFSVRDGAVRYKCTKSWDERLARYACNLYKILEQEAKDAGIH